MLVKVNYEKPVDTARDVLDRGITIIWYPGYEYYKDMMINQNLSKVSSDLAKNTYVSKVSHKLYLLLNRIL